MIFYVKIPKSDAAFFRVIVEKLEPFHFPGDRQAEAKITEPNYYEIPHALKAVINHNYSLEMPK